MFRHSRFAALVLSMSLGSVVLAQTSVMSSTVTKNSVISGTIQTIAGKKVTVLEASGTHEYTVPDGFKFQVDGQEVGLDQLKPGMQVTVNISDRITTREVTVNKGIDGNVVLVAPGGFVLQDTRHKYVSYDFKDSRGHDLYFLAPDGQEDTLRDVKVGDHLTGTLVTRFPPQVIDERVFRARAAAQAPQPASAPQATVTESVAVVEIAKLPRTASPLPLLGLLGALSAVVALALRGVRAPR